MPRLKLIFQWKSQALIFFFFSQVIKLGRIMHNQKSKELSATSLELQLTLSNKLLHKL